MGRLSQKFSQKYQTASKHAETRPVFTEFPFKYRSPQSNKHKTTHPRNCVVEFLNFLPTENSQPREKERRWSVKCEKKRKVGQMFYTVTEVAKDHLKVSRATVYRLLSQGHLQGAKLRGCTRITSAELERFERMMGGSK